MTSYKKFINNILETRGRFACGEEYHERHHILPKCLGGNNDEENLIDLFAREHFEAHRLLALENPDNAKLNYAWTMMAWIKTDHQHRYQVTPEEYEEAKKELSKLNRSKKGTPLGPMSDEHKRKISESNKGKVFSEETRKKLGDAHRNPSEETRKKMRENHADVSGENHPMFGRKHSLETRRKISESLKGNPSPMKGKHLSDDTKKKISQARIGKYTGEKNPNYGNHKLKGKYVGKNSFNYGTGKAVVQLTKEGNFVAEYISAYEAGSETNINRGGITQVCNHMNNRKTAGGFVWMFKDEYLENKLNCL